MSVNDIKPSDIEALSGTLSQTNMAIRIIGLMQGICFLLVIIGLVVGILYMIKSKKVLWKKIIIGIVIIFIPFIMNGILGIVKFNMLLNNKDSQHEINENSNVSNNITNERTSDNRVSSELWLNNYKNMPAQKKDCILNLFGNEKTNGLKTPIELDKLNGFSATYTYYPYNLEDKLETSNLNDIKDIAVSTVYARNEYDSLLFIINLYGNGLSFQKCIEEGKFLIETIGDGINGDFNISASQIGINIQNEHEDDASDTLDALINNLGSPTYIVANESLEEIALSNEFDISYKLIYKYDEYAIAFYVEEKLDEDNE